MRTAIASLALLGCTLLSSGCATIIGTVTGPFTNTVDLPRWFLEEDQMGPEWTFLSVVVFAPVGFITGPVYGFAKGVYVDVGSGLQGNFDYEEGWDSGVNSVWRPATYATSDR